MVTAPLPFYPVRPYACARALRQAMFHICLDRDAPATKEEVAQSRAEQSIG